MDCHQQNRVNRFRINGHPSEARREEILSIIERWVLFDTCSTTQEERQSCEILRKISQSIDMFSGNQEEELEPRVRRKKQRKYGLWVHRLIPGWVKDLFGVDGKSSQHG